MVLPVVVEGPRGKAKVDMALDTGSSFIVMPVRTARTLGYKLQGAEPEVNLHTPTTIEKAPLVTLLGVHAIGVRVALVEAACRDLPQQSPVEGLLGLSFLRHIDVDLHFRSGVLRARGPAGPSRRPPK